VSPMVLVLFPLVLMAVTLVAVGRALADVADEARQLRTVLARVQSLRPLMAEIGSGARTLGAGISRLGR